jgi:hypothetical protein
MSRKEKNRLTGLDRFLRYRGNNLSGKERNTFERELQKDPFAEEADEGMELTNSDLLRRDMDTLNKRLKSRIKGSARFVPYRIAASVAVLMVIAAVYFLLQKNRPSYQEELTAAKDILTPQLYAAPSPVPPATDDEQSKEIKDNAADNNERAVTARAVNQPAVAGRIAENEVKSEEVKEAKSAGKMEVAEGNEAHVENIASMKVEVAEDSTSPVTPQQNPIAAGEAAVPASRVKSVEVIEEAAYTKNDMKRQAAYTNADGPAGPVIGNDSYNKYIEKNIRIPSGQKDNQTEVVDLVFIVRLNGIPDSIRATNSPGKSYTDEAVRLIREGPPWKPAVENGILTEKKVNFRIIFK